LGETKEELLEEVIEGVAKLKDDPVAVYVNSTVYGVLDYWAVWHNGVHGALHAPAAWGELATNLAALLRGNATAAFLAYGRARPWETVRDAYKFIGLNDGKSGPENWPVDRLGLVHNLTQLTNQSLFGDRMYDVYFSKQAWSIPRRHNYVPKSKVKTAYPLLILSTTYDPVCPLVSAKSASEVFDGSRVVEVKGYGHCSPAMPSTCIARRVREYLYEGVLPEEHHSQCEADDKHFFSSPEVIDTNGAQDEKSRQLRLAQQELARGLWMMP
jgi:pimeloyl-ACP methyl ester carboxylesterase